MPVQLSRFVRTMRRLQRDSAGVSSLELGIVISLVALAALQSLTALGGEVEGDVNTAAAAVAEKRPERADPFARAEKSQLLPEPPREVVAQPSQPVEPPVAATQVYIVPPAQPEQPAPPETVIMLPVPEPY